MKFKTFYKIFYVHRFQKASGILKLYLYIVLPIRYLLNTFFFQKKINLDLFNPTSVNLYNKDLNFLFEYFNSDKGEFFIDQYVQPIKKVIKKLEHTDIQSFMKNFFLT